MSTNWEKYKLQDKKLKERNNQLRVFQIKWGTCLFRGEN